MASRTDIGNFALSLIGASKITSFSEGTKAARELNLRYDSIRDHVFRQHPWNCLIQRATLSQDSTTPAFGYNYQYLLPTNPACLKVLEFSNGSVTFPYDNMHNKDNTPVFVIENKKLLTNEATAKIKYVAQITNTTHYDASLVEVLAAALAYEICYSISGSQTLTDRMRLAYETKLRNARFDDATEGANQKIEASDFLEARI